MSECSGASSSPLSGLFLLLSISKPGCCSSGTLDLSRPCSYHGLGYLFFKGVCIKDLEETNSPSTSCSYFLPFSLLWVAYDLFPGTQQVRQADLSCRRWGRAPRAEARRQLLGARTESWGSQEAKAVLRSLRARVPASLSVCPGVLECSGLRYALGSEGEVLRPLARLRRLALKSRRSC